MGRLLMGLIIGALLGGGLGALIAVSGEGEVFIASDKPITEDEVCARLQSQGWTNVQTTRDDRYIEVIASKNGRVGHLTVDSLTGKLIVDDRGYD
jgi:hypothetical protein